MLIHFKKSALADSSEIDGVLSDMKRLQDQTETAFLELSGAQRMLQSRSEKIMELSNRLRHGAHPTREKERLESDLIKLKNTTELEKTVETKRQAYDELRNKLKTLQDRFSRDFLTVDIPSGKVA